MTQPRAGRGAAHGIRAPRVLVAPDSFKGTYSAGEVAAAIGAGLRAAGCTVDLAPVADGGEGTAEILATAVGACWVPQLATGPLGDPVPAGYYVSSDGVAFVDTAAASGLELVPRAVRTGETAMRATTAGTGELVGAALSAGARRVRLGVGGSATTDGGRGAVEALHDAGGLRDARLEVLCDVSSTWLEAPVVFGRQKGADTATVGLLVRRLDAYADELPRDPRGVPMTGAAGGLAGGLWAAFGAELVPGAAEVLREVGLRSRAARAVAVVTGEGRFDTQSALGKLVGSIRAAAGRPTHLVVGSSELGEAEARHAGYASLRIATDTGGLTRAGNEIGTELLRAR